MVDEPAHPDTALVPHTPTNLAIELSNVTLEYPLGAFAKGSLKSSLLSLLGHRERVPRPTYIQALRDVNFRIAYGERVGIVGHNGSGKSTLLRALAGIYPLAKGNIEIVGRVATLLEIGLGFEPESTGRENIYYRGMTLGYSRKQLQKVEADIVKFAELGDFIDMPMRTYSAGMYVRLGFAVSTQFAPEILLVDEVFGAGDASFAQKAMQRMLGIVQRSGIFVIATHDVSLIHRVCTRALWMEGGQLRMDGLPADVLPEYMRQMTGA